MINNTTELNLQIVNGTDTIRNISADASKLLEICDVYSHPGTTLQASLSHKGNPITEDFGNIIPYLKHLIANGSPKERTYVYMTRRNYDMTEGRGGMVNDLCFSTYELAAEYIDEQPGIMGRRAKWSTEKHGDWEIQTIEVLSNLVTPEDREREKALAKLTEKERKLLGLA